MREFILRITKPRSENEDAKRREFIVTILLVAVIILLTISIVSSIVTSFFVSSEALKNNALSLVVVVFFWSFFAGLYFLSRKGFFRLASFFLLIAFFLLSTYAGYRWGVDVTVGLLLDMLIIVMAGILINARFAFIVTFIIFLTIAIIGHLQRVGVIVVNDYWRTASWGMADTIIVAVMFAVVATVSWLSNREIERSLARAHKSEADLKAERDNLEIKVEERTRELKEMQAEKMTQVYRFAEFGRLSSGLFHDLINPLNAVSLNMERVRCQNNNGGTLAETKEYLDRAISASKKMEEFVIAVRKQLTKQGNEAMFSVMNEVKQVVEVLSYKALKNNVKIVFSPPDNDIEIFGDAIKFNQVALNLITNAIDAYAADKDIEKDPDRKDRRIIVSLKEEKDSIVLSVQDHGMGISEEHLNKIFEPFFTTKRSGMGIGLSMVKRIVEKDLGGIVKVESEVRKGATFTILIPKKTHEKNTK
jgi:signal transduction histidine kinase